MARHRPTGLSQLATAPGWTGFRVSFGPITAAIEIVGGAPAWTFSGSLAHEGERPVELQRFDYLVGAPADPALGLLAPQALQGATFSPPGTRAALRNAAFAKMWTGMGVRWGTAPDPVWDMADWALSRDLGVFARGWSGPGWTAAFTGPGLAFGEVGLNTGGRARLFIGQLLDGITIESGERRGLETATLRYGDWQSGIATWATDVAHALGPRPKTPAPVGFCSWYQFASDVTDAEFEQAAREVAALPAPPGGRLVQVDDGWQKLPATGQSTPSSPRAGPRYPPRSARRDRFPAAMSRRC